jgi:hypothetical protein
MYTDPEIVGPAGQVRLDSSFRLLDEARLGQRNGDIPVVHGPVVGIDLSERITHPRRLSSQTGAAEVGDEVDQPFGKQAAKVGLLPRATANSSGRPGNQPAASTTCSARAASTSRSGTRYMASPAPASLVANPFGRCGQPSRALASASAPHPSGLLAFARAMRR